MLPESHWKTIIPEIYALSEPGSAFLVDKDASVCYYIFSNTKYIA